jgi:hypothetical protein
MSSQAMKSAGYYDLRQALTEPGCALCRLLARVADNYIDGVLWELVNDPDIRRELNQARGYCQRHAWLLVRHGASLGAAILMQDVIETLLGVIEAGSFEPQAATFSLRQVWRSNGNSTEASAATANLVADLSPQVPCPVCAAVQKSENYYLDALVKHFRGPDSLDSVYRASAGFCLPHFRLALSRISNEATFAALVEAQKAVWQRLKAELDEFIRKNDYRFMEEGFGSEGNSWLRAIETISGAAPPKVKGL